MQPDTDLLIRNFHDNLNFFEDKYPAVFYKLTSLETALVNGYYIPVYELVYENGYFDVIRLATGAPYYGENSLQSGKKMASDVTYNKNEGVFETFSNPDCSAGDFIDILKNHTNAVCSFAHYTQNATADLDKMEKIHKYIVLGVGLGFHLQEIDRKIAAGAYLIIEDDLELFRLSLFTIRYVELAEKSDLEFSIFENDVEFDRTISSFLNKGFFFNHRIKFNFMEEHPVEKVKLIQHAILTQRHLTFSFNNMLWTALRPLDYIESGYAFLDIKEHNRNSPFFDKPVLMIAAGPSLQKNSEWLQKNHNLFTVVAVSAALRSLYTLGIAPDIVTHIDGFQASEGHFQGLEREYLAEVILIARSNAHPGIMPYFQKENIFLFETGSSYFDNIGSISTPCVGSSSYLLLLRLGVKKLYLLGLDLALDQTTGSTHSDSHIQNRTVDIFGSDTIDYEASARTTILRVKGNLSEEVLTVPQLKQSLDDLYLLIPEYLAGDQKIYNLGCGAYIPGTVAKKISETGIGFNDTASIRQLLIGFFRENARCGLNTSEFESCKKRLAHAMEFKQTIDNHGNGNYADFNNYQSALFDLIKDTIHVGSGENGDLSYILLTYYKLVLTFVFDMFNTQGLTREKEHIVCVQHMLSTHLIQIVEAYERRLNNFLKL